MRTNQTSLTLAVLALALFGCHQTPSTSDYLGRPDRPRDDLTGVPSPFVASNPTLPKSGEVLAPVVRRISKTYGIDWVLVMAIMNQESRFDHDALSQKGAYGLMQIMPHTRSEIAERLGFEEALTPKNNIKAGIYHLRGLERYFRNAPEEDRIRLVLAAYNAGLSRIKDAQVIARHLGEDSNSWESVRSALPLLARRYETFHGQIWESGKPAGGLFGNWRQTTSYVDRVMEYFENYTLAVR